MPILQIVYWSTKVDLLQQAAQALVAVGQFLPPGSTSPLPLPLSLPLLVLLVRAAVLPLATEVAIAVWVGPCDRDPRVAGNSVRVISLRG